MTLYITPYILRPTLTCLCEFVIHYTEIGSSEIASETGCTVNYYAVNTAESVSSNGTKVTLHGRDLWMDFHKCTTEMIITKAGR